MNDRPDDGTGSGRARLYVLAGPDQARTFEVDGRAVMGRAPECEVVLHDRSISRRHAQLTWRDGRWTLEDLGSTNGVKQAGKRVEKLTLADGDEFELGDLPLRFRVREAEEPSLDLEFADPTPVSPAPASPVPVPAPLSSARPARPPAPEPLEDEIELELPDEPGAPQAPLRRPGPAVEATTFQPRRERRTGWLAGDLSQFPFWQRVLLVGVLGVVGAGLCYGAFWAVTLLRGGP